MRGNFQGNLLDYYQRELRYLRRMGAEFGAKFPKVASRLQLGGEESPDPHVERLIESFAFLAARIQLGIDGEFPLIPQALLGILYPHLLDPVPSMAIARFEPDPEQGALSTGFAVPRHTSLFAETGTGETVRFRTGYDVALWPVAIETVALESAAQYGFLDRSDVTSVLRVRLRATGQVGFPEMGMRHLRFYLAGDHGQAGALYELLLSRVGRVAVLPDGRPEPTWLPRSVLRGVGFGRDEDVIPHSPRGHPAYRLLQEYFAFPEKYLFVDVDLAGAQGSGAQQAFDLVFLLDGRPDPRLMVYPDSLQLGCTPIVNLFPRTSEPVRLDETRFDYRLVADARWERITEIHSIRSVSASADVREAAEELSPFFSFHHDPAGRNERAFWYATRQDSQRADLPGTEMMLNFVDLDFKPGLPAVKTVYAHTLCTNRGLANQLPPDAVLHGEDAAPVTRIVCLTQPTNQVYNPVGGPTLWRLISHLTVNYLSLEDEKEGLEAIREILRLHAPPNRPAMERQISGIKGLSWRPVVRRVGPDAWRGFVRGTEVTLAFDDNHFAGGSAFLMSAMLSRFLGLYGSLNSFTQLVTRKSGREGIWMTWPPAAGEQAVL